VHAFRRSSREQAVATVRTFIETACGGLLFEARPGSCVLHYGDRVQNVIAISDGLRIDDRLRARAWDPALVEQAFAAGPGVLATKPTTNPARFRWSRSTQETTARQWICSPGAR
jgi:hypothetical protein